MTASHAYRAFVPEDADALAYLARQGFGIPREDFDRSAALFGAETLRVLERAGRPEAAAAVWTMDQWFGGRPVPSRAVAFVSVDPVARGSGVGGRLMAAALEEARAEGAALAVLYPATVPLYAKAGFARAGSWFSYRAAPDVLARGRPAGPLPERMEELDADRLAAVRLAAAARSNGLPVRNEAMWTMALRADGADSDIYVVPGPDGAAGLEGYAAVKPRVGRRLPVADVCVLTPRAARAVLALVAGHRSQVDEVVWRGGPQDPLVHAAHDARIAVDGWEQWMLRIVNVERALEARGYPAGVSVALTLTVEDRAMPDNGGRFRLTVAGGRGHVERLAGPGPADVTLSAAALAPLYSGHLGPAALVEDRALDASPEALGLLALAFGGPPPWMPDRF